MDAKRFLRRIYILIGIFALCIGIFGVTLFNAQIVHGEENYQKAVQTITIKETVPASRGVITDRNGKVIVSNRLVYQLSFDSGVFDSDEEENAAITRLLTLLKRYGISWTDTLPLAKDDCVYTTDAANSSSLRRFSAYLENRKLSFKTLSADDPTPEIGALTLCSEMRKDFGIDPALSYAEARLIMGVRYELSARRLISSDEYVLAQDFGVDLISELSDGNYLGAKIGTGTIRQYETAAAAHILGYVGDIWEEEYAELKSKGYKLNDIVGKVGVEKAFEEFLHGNAGTRVITTNDAGKITGEVYSTDPRPGNTVALTLDLDLQEDVERILAETTEAMTEEDGAVRGSACAVVGVGSGEVLALASYPTYSLDTFNRDYEALRDDPNKPLLNRATYGVYAPGSTFKPITAVAALESGVITPRTIIRDMGIYRYYAPDYQPRCWIYSSYGGTHGNEDVSHAITDSCNYFFYEVGRLTGIDTIDAYAEQFGLGTGAKTGIETGETSGSVLASRAAAENYGSHWYDGQTLSAAIGQSYHQFTPLQMANYVATLVGGGEHYATHLLKNVKTYDNASVVEVYDEKPLNVVDMDDDTVEAVLSGMKRLTESGSIASYFRSCNISAGAKTGTAQTGSTNANGVFICFAPYDDPEIAVALVIEKGNHGSALAAAAVEILNSYFSTAAEVSSITGENTLLP